MTEMSTSDQLHLRAAEGWLELGNPGEAAAELDGISSECSNHPDVLALRWHIAARGNDWPATMKFAQMLTQTAPEDPRGWVALAESIYFEKRYQDAYDLAVSKITSFPKHWPLYYDAACYACLTGRTLQARQFLQLAMAFGESNLVELKAKQDPDLAELWKER
jgi:hypothetical protein